MSEFTFSTIIRNASSKEIEEYLRREGINGYVLTANQTWVAVAIENSEDKGEEFAKTLSKKLKEYVFYFMHGEDHGWSYTLFFDGVTAADLVIDYEEVFEERNNTNSGLDADEIKRANIFLLRKIGGNNRYLDQLEDYLSNCRKDTKRVLEGVNFFKEAFDFHKIHWVSYEYFADMSMEELKRIKVTPVVKGNINAKINLKKVVLGEIESDLKELGYFFDKAKSGEGLFSFFKKDGNYFDLGLAIDKSTMSSTLRPYIHVPTFQTINLFYVTDGDRKEFEYSNIEELKSALKIIRDSFVNNGDKWVKEHQTEFFDAGLVYNEVVDELLDKHNFKRVRTSEDILHGGVVSYGKDALKISFYHAKDKAIIACNIFDGQQEKLLRTFLEELNVKDVQLGTFYKNREEYIDIIKSCLDAINKYIIIPQPC